MPWRHRKTKTKTTKFTQQVLMRQGESLRRGPPSFGGEDVPQQTLNGAQAACIFLASCLCCFCAGNTHRCTLIQRRAHTHVTSTCAHTLPLLPPGVLTLLQTVHVLSVTASLFTPVVCACACVCVCVCVCVCKREKEGQKETIPF